MNAPLTLHHNENHKVFFISDTHFGHNKEFIYRHRGFKNIEEHNCYILENWNAMVRPCDTVVHLGDFIAGARENTNKLGDYLLSKLNGEKIILWGNHNAYLKTLYKRLVYDTYRNDNIEVYPISTNEFGSNVTFVGNDLLCKIKTNKNTQFVFCSHFAHRTWIGSHKGVWSFCGHSHGKDVESQPTSNTCERLDVGVDNFKYPQSFDDLAKFIKEKSKKIIWQELKKK